MQSDVVDLYELLQISRSAEMETVHRMFRVLARRWHPDNAQTGDPIQFRIIHDAYLVLSDPAKRAEYDATLDRQRRMRVTPVPATEPLVTVSFAMEQVYRQRVLELLYAHRRADLNRPGIFILDLEGLAGIERENLEFTLWYLQQKGLVQRTDNSRLAITVEGVDYLEANTHEAPNRRRLTTSSAAA
jgi:curved DNA-binding protein CbpA